LAIISANYATQLTGAITASAEPATVLLIWGTEDVLTMTVTTNLMFLGKHTPSSASANAFQGLLLQTTLPGNGTWEDYDSD